MKHSVLKDTSCLGTLPPSTQVDQDTTIEGCCWKHHRTIQPSDYQYAWSCAWFDCYVSLTNDILELPVLILCAITSIQAFPYTVPSFVPDLWDVLTRHASDPAPIGPDIRKYVAKEQVGECASDTIIFRRCAAAFRQTHTDSWHEDKLKFTDDQLSNLSYVISGTSYCEYITHLLRQYCL